MAGTDLILLMLQHTLTVLLVLLVLHGLKATSASRRVFAARCGLSALAVMPLAWMLVPEVPLRLPYAWTALLAPPAVLPDLAWLANAPPPAAGFAAPSRAVELGRALLFVYGLVVLLYFARMVFSMWRLGRIARSAAVVTAPEWRAALHAQHAASGIGRPVRLLVSERIASPLSWGLLRPVIVLDRNSHDSVAAAPVVAHELAHIAAHDWVITLLARTLLAVYWWHPLMHLLVRSMEHDMECAADDATLRAGVRPSEYAQTLVHVSRHAFGGAGHGRLAQPIAGRGSALAARIGALLEVHRARAKVTRMQWVGGAAVTTVVVAVLGGLVLKGEYVVWPDHLFDRAAAMAGQDASVLLAAMDNPNFTQLAAAMRAGDFGMRHATQVASFRQRAAIPALILSLQDRRAVVRQLGAWALSEMRFPETAPALAVLLADPAPLVRAEAAGALGDMGELRWLDSLHAMLRDTDPRVRRRVAHALGDLAQEASTSALEAARHDPDRRVAEQVQWALHELR